MYNAPVKTIKSIGLDVTTHVTMAKPEFAEKIKENSAFKPVVDFMNVKNPDGFITFHDPLAAAVIFDGNICKFSRGAIETELASERSKGLLYFEESQNGKNEAAMHVDSDRFFRHFFETVNIIL
jgi:purine nucleosidase